MAMWLRGVAAAVGGAALTLGALGLAGGGLACAEQSHEQPASRQEQPPAQPAAGVELADELSAAFERVAGLIRPSVVNISSKRVVRSPFAGFGVFGFSDQPLIQEGQGTGFVISPEGYLLTNNHVVQDAAEVNVRFEDGSEYTALVIGTDPQTDIAVLKVDADNLTPLPLGDSDSVRVGEWVIAAGNPFGLRSTITAGIVSATGRTGVGIIDQGYEDFIQTDAAINPGNSGGPLVNLRGEVIGINTAIFTRTGGNMGIGFAVPVNMAKYVAEQIIAEGRVVRGQIGVTLQPVNERLARALGHDGRSGAVVTMVLPGTPAEEAGLREGDVITSVNGVEVRDDAALKLRLAQLRPGAEARLGVSRGGAKRTVTVEIAARETGEARRQSRAPAAARIADAGLGLEVASLSPRVNARLGLPERLTGVVVTNVQAFSAAARAGLKPGDIIVEADRTEVTSVDDLRRALTRERLREGVLLRVLNRADVPRYAVLEMN